MAHRLAVQEFLETSTVGELAAEWGVYFTGCGEHKMSGNYDMIEFTPGHYPSEQCRGLILRTFKPISYVNGKIDPNFCPGPTEIMAYPLDKFYNSDEGFAAKVNWSDTKLSVEEKLDGTLCIVYWDTVKSEWHVATRSVPEANVAIDGRPDLTFRILFEKAVQEMGSTFGEFTELLAKDMTWCFELTSPYNRIFVNYPDSKLTLIACRTLDTLKELDRNLYNDLFALPKTFAVRTLDDLKLFVNELPPDKCEGAVVMDSQFRRVKVKNQQWIIANSIKTGLSASPRNLVRYVLRGIADDITSMLPPDTRERIDAVQVGLVKLFAEVDHNFVAWKEEAGTNRKHFAELVNQNSRWSSPFFKMYEGKAVSCRAYIDDLLKREKLSDSNIDTLLNLIGQT